MSCFTTWIIGSIDWGDAKSAELHHHVLVLCCDHGDCRNTYQGRPGFYKDTCISAASDTGWWGWDENYEGPHYCGDHSQPEPTGPIGSS